MAEFKRFDPSSDDIRELLKLAGIDSCDETAISRLRLHLEDAHGVFIGKSRPVPKDHNEPLNDIIKFTNKLLNTLATLENAYPHANAALWCNHLWSDSQFTLRDSAHIAVTVTLESLKKSAEKARYTHNGRLPGTPKRIIKCAFDFFVRNSPQQLTTTPTGKFGKFATKFYEVATCESRLDLERTIRTVVKEYRKPREDPVFFNS